MGTGRQYDEEFKKQAIKLGKEVGIKAAAEELGIPKGTLGTWLKKARTGEIDTGSEQGRQRNLLISQSSCRLLISELKSLKRQIESLRN